MKSLLTRPGGGRLDGREPGATRPYARPRRIVIRGSIALLLAGTIAVASYFALFRMLPWQTSSGMADAILAGVSAPATAAPFGRGDRRTAKSPAGSLITVAANTMHSAAHASPDPATPVIGHGSVQSSTITSKILGDSRPFLIYLPPAYDRSRQHYPVLYLLHGAPGNYKDWMRAGGIDKTLDAMIAIGRIPPLIVVLPEGNGGFFGDTEWANSADGQVRAEDYLTQEVVPFIDTHYPTLADRDHRAIGGLSTGGYGAVNLTLHHPDLFGYALSLSGNYLAAKTWTGQDMWGSDSQAKAYNSPLLYAPSAGDIQSLHIYLTVSPTDNTDNTYTQTAQFDALLARLGVPHKTEYFPGDHSWTFWGTHIVDALDYLAKSLPPAAHRNTG